jgi:hypothetical protein
MAALLTTLNLPQAKVSEQTLDNLNAASQRFTIEGNFKKALLGIDPHHSRRNTKLAWDLAICQT